MSITQSPVPEKKPDLINIPVPMFSLNEILRESMKNLYAPDVIIRCESLPYIKGNHTEIARLFNMLISLITDYRPAAPQLFLYVDCDSGTREVGLEQGFKKFMIKLYTNITTDEAWKQVNHEVLSACDKIVTDHNGQLQVNTIKNTGCLFAISLAGKFA
jgi:hypothetical protein